MAERHGAFFDVRDNNGAMLATARAPIPFRGQDLYGPIFHAEPATVPCVAAP